MTLPDFNLLVTLDVLLSEVSVTRAAVRLRLSPSAMSRALTRLRAATGDPLLVRAGRGMVPTPRALALRDEVAALVRSGETMLRPVEPPDLTRLVRTFALRTSDGFVDTFGPALLARLGREAPGVRLRFVPKTDKTSVALRDGSVDLETGVAGKGTSPDLHVQSLFRDRFVGVVRSRHPLARGRMTAARYAAGRHVFVSRRGVDRGPADDALEAAGLRREIVAVVGGWSEAVALARGSDLIATVPERHTAGMRHGMHTFSLPLALPDLRVALLWHARSHADPAHRWLRGLVREIAGASRAG